MIVNIVVGVINGWHSSCSVYMNYHCQHLKIYYEQND